MSGLAYREQLVRWFAPDQHGWFGGDNHVHAQHDAHALVRTDNDANVASTLGRSKEAAMSRHTVILVP